MADRTCAWCDKAAKKSGKCTDCQREYMRQWRARPGNRERHNEHAVQSYRRRQERDPGASARASAAWREKNPGRHAEVSRAYVARRRARKAGATTEHFTPAELLAHWDDIGAYACVYCSAPFEHIDHVMPLALGGAHALDNLLPACAECNLAKSARDPWEYLRSRGVTDELLSKFTH